MPVAHTDAYRKEGFHYYCGHGWQ
ncbi:hypothetical protein FRAAL0648 [Frankia alni ACN14a]|uniref:Uncharacterized protein n=1 Tax=Frankia alni (strain DSM 45986 / CECT 9034 / ACN14a) TaxID=326424 RepID=Q0RSY2_FRAAA|nr:hypothetical protein FRAAL0648 [Frankia alni ACN14a]